MGTKLDDCVSYNDFYRNIMETRYDRSDFHFLRCKIILWWQPKKPLGYAWLAVPSRGHPLQQLWNTHCDSNVSLCESPVEMLDLLKQLFETSTEIPIKVTRTSAF